MSKKPLFRRGPNGHADEDSQPRRSENSLFIPESPSNSPLPRHGRTTNGIATPVSAATPTPSTLPVRSNAPVAKFEPAAGPATTAPIVNIDAESEGENDIVPEIAEEEGNYEDDERDEEEDDDDEESDVGGFVPRPKLPEPKVVSYKLGKLIELLNSPYLDLEPSYQREVVWSGARMTGLINSLFENFYVPPVIFSYFEVERPQSEGGGEAHKRVCVDGKQRLSSIRAFMNGEIACLDRKGKKWIYTQKLNKAGKAIAGYRMLSERNKEEFRNKELVCYEYYRLSREQEEDLFARVQKGMSLNEAEKFKATDGEWQRFATMFEEDFKDVISLCANKRAAGWRHILESFSQIMEAQHPSGAKGEAKFRTSRTAIATMLKNPKLLTENLKSQLRRTFITFSQLLQSYPQAFKDNAYTRVKTFSPLELVSVAVLIALHPGRPKGMLKGDILHLRGELRNRNVDLRLNSSCWKDSWFIISTIEDTRGATDPSAMIPLKPKGARESQRVARRPKSANQDKFGDDENDQTYDPAGVQPASDSRPKRGGVAINQNHSAARSPAIGNGHVTESVRGTPRTGSEYRPLPPAEALRVAADEAIRGAIGSTGQTDSRPSSAQAPVAPMSDGNFRRKRAPLDLGNSVSTARNLEKRIKRSPSTERAEQEAAARSLAR
ncbi:MAG: hypothetical protein M1837_003165 [Sclerophora amabilis]|nr:MAG: hypothetical protein M1837_003165 [Sclerophora amabilis]